MLWGAPRPALRPWGRSARGAAAAFLLWLGAMSGAASADEITLARYGAPTEIYPHAVLGDALEWASLTISVLRDGADQPRTYQVSPAKNAVFEDIAPRLWDVTGDGRPEVVVVESDQTRGARLLILGLANGSPKVLAATPHIGQRFRWLAPVGAADLDGDGAIEIAYVDRPHLARTLRVWRYLDGTLSQVAMATGLTNHRIGEDFISGGVRTCAGRPELITANADWTRIVASRLDSGHILQSDIGPFAGRTTMADALACR